MRIEIRLSPIEVVAMCGSEDPFDWDDCEEEEEEVGAGLKPAPTMGMT